MVSKKSKNANTCSSLSQLFLSIKIYGGKLPMPDLSSCRLLKQIPLWHVVKISSNFMLCHWALMKNPPWISVIKTRGNSCQQVWHFFIPTHLWKPWICWHLHREIRLIDYPHGAGKDRDGSMMWWLGRRVSHHSPQPCSHITEQL